MSAKRKVGRPTTYKPEYCEMLVEHMKDGLSFESFAAVVNVNRDTVHEWKRVHPEFSESKNRGEAQSMIWWEKLGRAAAAGKVPNFNAAVFIFSMKNKFGWRDRIDANIQVDVTHKPLQISEIKEVLASDEFTTIELEAKDGDKSTNTPH
jgi:hypothetical protein